MKLEFIKTDTAKRLELADDNNRTFTPERKHRSAGYDLKACITAKITILPNEIVTIPTGIKINLSDIKKEIDSYEENVFSLVALLFIRSGTSKYFRLCNGVGVIDVDYQGEIAFILQNITEDFLSIEPFERLGQFVLTPCLHPQNIFEVSSFSETTERGENGFGSTGR